MDRTIVYPGAIPLETDILNTNRNAMLGIGAIASAIFGAATFANGLACGPTSPASMSVGIGPGEIYTRDNVDDTAYSSLPADTVHQTIKQGLQNTTIALACAAPATAGASINYLVQASFSEVDDDATVLNYYNSSDPTTPYTGPSNSGASQATTRSGAIALSAKAGVAATTGSQATPAPDAGFIGLWVVTVAYGATTITAANITQYAGAKALPSTGLVGAIQNNSFSYAVAGGTANALTATLSPAPSTLIVGMEIILKTPLGNTGAATLNVNGFGATAITMNGNALGAGAIKSGQLHALIYDGANWQLKTPNADGIIAYSLGATGYEIYSHGKIEQWGTASVAPPTTAGPVNSATVTYPIPFPNACFGLTGNHTSIPNTGWNPADVSFPSASRGKTTFVVTVDTTDPSQNITQAVSVFWRAIGN